MEIIEGMEKLFLSCLLSYNKLDIVNEKHVYIAVFFTEFGHCSIVSITNGLDQLVRKGLTGYIKHLFFRIFIEYKMCNGMHQMGFSQSGASVNEERIVHFAR